MDPLHADLANQIILAIIALANLATAIVAVIANNRSKLNKITLDANHATLNDTAAQMNRLEKNTNDKMDKVMALNTTLSLAAGNVNGRKELLAEQDRESKKD